MVKRVQAYVLSRTMCKTVWSQGRHFPSLSLLPHLQIMEPTDGVTVVTVICFCSDDAAFIHFSSFPSLTVASGMFREEDSCVHNLSSRIYAKQMKHRFWLQCVWKIIHVNLHCVTTAWHRMSRLGKKVNGTWNRNSIDTRRISWAFWSHEPQYSMGRF